MFEFLKKLFKLKKDEVQEVIPNVPKKVKKSVVEKPVSKKKALQVEVVEVVKPRRASKSKVAQPPAKQEDVVEVVKQRVTKSKVARPPVKKEEVILPVEKPKKARSKKAEIVEFKPVAEKKPRTKKGD